MSGLANRARKEWSLLDQLMLRNFFCGDPPAELIFLYSAPEGKPQSRIHARGDSRSLRITLPGNPNAFNFVTSPAMLHDDYEPRPLVSEQSVAIALLCLYFHSIFSISINIFT